MLSAKGKTKSPSCPLSLSEGDDNSIGSDEYLSDTCDEYGDDGPVDGVSSGFIYYDESEINSHENTPRSPPRTIYTMVKPVISKKTDSSVERYLRELGHDQFNEDAWNLIDQPKKVDLQLLLVEMAQNFKFTNCDVIIDDVIFRCHSLVLKCYSDYFLEKDVDVIILSKKNVPVETFTLIYDWMLQIKPIVPRYNIMGTFTSAKYLEIKDLVEQCWACLDNSDMFYEQSAFVLYLEAKFYNQRLVQELMTTRISQYFISLVASKDFLYLTSYELCELLHCNTLAVNSEAEVFMAAIRWLNFKWEYRKRYVLEVMKHVRFGLMPPWYLVILQRHFSNKEIKRVIEHTEVTNLINEGYSYGTAKLYYSSETGQYKDILPHFNLIEPPLRQWICDENCPYHHRVDCPKKIGVTYELFSNYLRQVRASGKDYWRTYKTSSDIAIVCCTEDSPHIADIFFGKATDKFNRNNANKGILNKKGFIVLPCRKKSEVSCNDSKLTVMSKATPNTNISMLDDPSTVYYLEKTNINSNNSKSSNVSEAAKWTSRSNLIMGNAGDSMNGSPQLPKKKLNASKHYEGDKIFVFGASTPSQRVSKSIGEANVYYYDVYNNEWIPLFKMDVPRYQASAVAYDRKIFIIGGVVSNSDNSNKATSPEVWSFDPVGLLWNKELSLPSARKEFATVSHESGLYVIGGQTIDGVVLSTILCYNRNLKKWIEKTPMIYARIGFTAALVKDEIWVAGGMVDKKDGLPILSDTIEAFNIEMNSWSLVAKLPSPISYGKLCVSRFDDIYYTGGLTFKQNKFKPMKTILKYNNLKQSWKTVGEMKHSRHSHEALIVIGKCFIFGGIVENQPLNYSHVDCLCLKKLVWIDGVASLPVELLGLAAVKFNQ